MDQDNSAGTSLANDSNIFIGSSNIADGGGRQLWDNKYGDLRGDRRHKLKVYGHYTLPWKASVGAFAIYQSGQPWEEHNYRFYPTSIRASGLAICASAPLTLGFAVFPMLVPMAIGRVGWEAGLSLVVVPLLLASVVAALCLPNRPSGLPVS